MRHTEKKIKTVADLYRANGWTEGSILEITQNGVVYRKQVTQIGPQESVTSRMISVTVNGEPVFDTSSNLYRAWPNDLRNWQKVDG